MIVTLLTDFGTADPFVAAMKGVILSRAPAATLVDVTHEVPPQDVVTAALHLLATYPLFPPGTVHLAVVDPGVGSARRPLLVEAGGQRFVGPDNGLFGPVLDREPGWRALHLDQPRFFRHPLSATFHGRDLFAPVAAALASGTPAGELGSEIRDPVRWDLPSNTRGPGGVVRGSVLHVDRFGNCVTSLSRRDVDPGALDPGFRLRAGRRDVRALRRFYADGAPGEPFVIWGSSDLLEISVDRASASALLGVARGAEVELHPA